MTRPNTHGGIDNGAVLHPAEDAEIEACGDTWHVRRTLALLRRVEQIAGPAWPMQEALRKAAVTQHSLALLYEAVLRDEPGAPARQDLAQWIWVTGTHKPALAMATVIASLVVGNENLRRLAGTDVPEGDDPDADPTRPVRPG